MRNLRTKLLGTACAAALAAAAIIPAHANEQPLSSLCGSGYGGTFRSPYWTVYTGSNDCPEKYLQWGWVEGPPNYTAHDLFPGYSAYYMVYNVPTNAVSAYGWHKICNVGHSICSVLTNTSD